MRQAQAQAQTCMHGAAAEMDLKTSRGCTYDSASCSKQNDLGMQTQTNEQPQLQLQLHRNKLKAVGCKMEDVKLSQNGFV
jgi:hypothetical protein